MANIARNNFTAGWAPADDKINGRKNALLQADNVELDINGALSMIGGTVIKYGAYPSNAHTLYPCLVNGARADYAALANGAIYRNFTALAAGGDTLNAAFATAFNFTLICSGTKLLKDDGVTAINLGVLPPTAAPTVVAAALTVPYAVIGDIAVNTVTPVGASAVVGSYLQITANGAGQAAVQTFAGVGMPHNATRMSNSSAVFFPNTGFGLDSDTLNITGYTVQPIGKTLKIDVLLVVPGGAGAIVSDFYSYSTDLGNATFDPIIGTFTLKIARNQFDRIGLGAQDWTTIYGFRITYSGDPADVINILGANAGTTELWLTGGSKAQLGTYQYAQVNVNNTGSYFAKSVLGPATDPIVLDNNQASVIPQNPGAIDAQVNEIWIYRRGGLLEQWYRVGVFSTYGLYFDQVGDQAALTLDLTINLNLISVKSIPDKIYQIVGPIQQRWYYFTTNLMYPSDYNDPDLVDASIAIRTTGNNSEKFMWAKQADTAQVLVGTSVDVYSLAGTFATLPDNTLDIYYHAMGCKFPPITYDADSYAGIVVYLANDGWRSINAGHDNPLLVAPNSDTLYRGISSYGYAAPNLKIVPGAVRFPICIAQNKLWCFITGTNRCEVFDMLRKYWRTFNYGLGDATAAAWTPDGQVLAFYGTDKKTREIGVSTSKLIDGTTKQTVTLLWTVEDCGAPRQRKDSSTFKTRVYTGGDSCAVNITNDLNTTANIGVVNSSGAGLDKFIDISAVADVALVKTYQVKLVGTMTDFLLEDWDISYELRPPQVSFYRRLPDNFGNASKKRVRVWPLVLDSLGNDVIFTPDVDNTAYSTTTLNTAVKATKFTHFITDVFGIDYGFTLHSTGLFEFFGELPPTIVEVLPIAKRFDQVGPEDFFKYGKIQQFELRVMPRGGSLLPYTIYMSDSSQLTGSFPVNDLKEDSYYIIVPKGTNGRIVRMTFGPTNFDFHRFYVRMKVSTSGSETDEKWITIANE